MAKPVHSHSYWLLGRDISIKIAVKVAEEAYAEGTASTYPEPEVSQPLSLIKPRVKLYTTEMCRLESEKA